MQISIIMPVLNEAAGIVRILEPLQPLRAAGHELILVDGGSQDNTIELTESLIDRVLTSAPGRATQMHSGASQANGMILWFLHADTQVPQTAVEDLLRAVCQQGNKPFWGRFDVAISGTHPLLPIVAWLMNKRSRLTAVATGDQGIFVAHSLYRDSGGFRLIEIMEDIELSKRLRRVCPPLCLTGPLITSGRRWEQQGVWRTIGFMWFMRLAYFLRVSPKRLADWYYPGR